MLGSPPPLGMGPQPVAANLSQEAIVLYASDSVQWRPLTATMEEEKESECRVKRTKRRFSHNLVGTEKQTTSLPAFIPLPLDSAEELSSA